MPSTIKLNDYINGMRFSPSTTTALGANRYFALYSAAPTITGGGTELSGNGYGRVLVTSGMVGSSTGTTTRTLTNLLDIRFPEVITANWPLVTHIGVHDHPTNDSLLDFYDLTDLTATVGTIPVILAGTLSFSSGS
jgi:hypothetical protein